MVTIELGGHIHVHDIPVSQDHLRAGNAMTYDLVGADTHSGREAVKPELAWPPTERTRVLSYPGIDVGRAHTRLDPRSDVGQSLCGSTPGGSHPGQLLGAHDLYRHRVRLSRPPRIVEYLLGMGRLCRGL